MKQGLRWSALRTKVAILIVACGCSGLATGVSLPALGMQIDGRYIGSITRSDLTGTTIFGDQTIDIMQHQLDMWTRGTTPGGLDLRLRAFLRYLSELGVGDGDVFRYRFQGELIAQTWRLEGQFTPWQAVSPGRGPAKERFGYINARIVPRNLPHLFAEWQHREREIGLGASANDDRRVELSYGTEDVGGFVGVRRIDADDRRPNGVDQVTEELRAGARGRTMVKKVTLSADYDFLMSDFSARERRRDLEAHRINAAVNWRPLRTVSLFGTALQRWQSTDDNAFPLPIDTDETFLSGGVQYQPIVPLTFQLARDYRQTNEAQGRLVADYLRFETTFRDAIWRRVELLAGFRRTERIKDTAENRGGIPTNSVYAMMDGPILRGMAGRVEASYQRDTSTDIHRDQSRQLLQLRTVPVPTTRFDITWTRLSQPNFAGLRQGTRQWDLLLGYNPTQSFSFVGSYRRDAAEGLLDRIDNITSLNASWLATREVSLAANWERRTSSLRAFESEERLFGFDLGFWLPREFRVLLSTQQVEQQNGPRSRYYSANLQKDF